MPSWSGKASVGYGATREEAVEDCVRQARVGVHVVAELGKGVVLPLEIAEKTPASMPDGFGLLILVRYGHSDGEPYDWRLFAIKYGSYELRSSSSLYPGWKYTVGQKPIAYTFADCNADYEYLLPRGSMEFVDEDWVSRESAEYHY